MARRRMLNPMFFLDPDVAMLSPWARLLFESLWCLADREGRLEDKPKRILIQTFPFDKDINIEGHLSELVEQEFIQRYKANGKDYIQIRSFLTHQNPHPKETPSKIPPPPAVESRGEPCNSTAGIPQPCGIQNTESESSADTESKARAAAPFVVRARDEAECLRLVEAIRDHPGLATSKLWPGQDPRADGTQIILAASEFKGRGIVNPATMSDGRLAQTNNTLRKWLKSLEPTTSPPKVRYESQIARAEREFQEQQAREKAAS